MPQVRKRIGTQTPKIARKSRVPTVSEQLLECQPAARLPGGRALRVSMIHASNPHREPRIRGLVAIVFHAIAVILFAVHAGAQTAGTATIQGVVTDTTGAAVPNAVITLTLTETGLTRSTVSDGQGIYSLPNIPIGPYTLSVTAASFQGFKQHGVLEVGNNIQVNVPLQVGAATEQIEVMADQQALETETSTFKQLIDSQRITEMPLNGRQATQLILVSGGAVNAPSGDMVGSKNYASSVVINVAGGQGNYNNYTLDGGTYTDTFTNVNLPYPFPDALREFSVESNSLPARNGLHPGALVNGVTVSGTNQIHGSAFEFLRNNIINANNFFSSTKDTLKRNQFGGTFGGAIIRDKLFYFGGYQGTRERKQNNATSFCIPTPAELNGDFSQMGGSCAAKAKTLIDPISGANISSTRKLTSTSELSPQALALTKMLPTSQEDQFGFVKVTLPGNNNEDQFIGRIDYSVRQNHTLYARYFLTNYKAPAYYSPTNLLLTTTAGNDERVQSVIVGDSYTITPKLVNTASATYDRRRDNRGPTAGGINSTKIGVSMYDYVPADLRLSVTNGFSTGCGTCSPGFFNTNTEGFNDDVEYIQGKHDVAFGIEVVRTGDNTQAGYLQNGNYTFGGTVSGEGMVDFLTGRMSAFGQSRAQQTTFRQTIPSAYVQDTYHWTPRLTVNAGVRWEPNYFQRDEFGRGSTFSYPDFLAGNHSTVFPNAPAGSFYYRDKGVPKSFTDNHPSDFSPRFGVTFDPTGKSRMVVRAGGAIMYDSPSLYATQRMTSNPPYADEIDLNGNISFANPWSAYPGGDPFPGTYPPDASSTFPTSSLYIVLPRHIQIPTVYQWTASVERDLGRGWNVSINYLGNENAHLWQGIGINPSVYVPGTSTGQPGSCGSMTALPKAGSPCSSTKNYNDRTVLSLKNPTQGSYYNQNFTQLYTGGTSSYNGMIVALQHRMSRTFSFLANYTWSHCISTGDANGDVTGNSFMVPSNPRLDRGPCGFDIRHIFNTTVVARSNFSSLHGWAGAFANHWEVAPLVRVLSGVPLNVTTGSVDVSLTGQALDRPNPVAGAGAYTEQKIVPSGKTGNHAYLNPAAFANAATGSFGTLGRNAFRGPNYYDVDMALNRTFPLHDRLNFNLRIEAFNMFNHPFFTTFTTTTSSSQFGWATAAADPRIFQAAGKFTF